MAVTNYEKYFCFSIDLTLATRIIAFIGVAVSVLLVSVLLNDLSAKNFHVSRKIALGLGLDWRHIHSEVDISETADPEGKIIIILFAVYAILFFATNVTLLLGAILEKPYLAIPWLTSEFVGCLSKLIGLLYHFISSETNDLNNIFIIGSIIYILVTIWWWVVVYATKLKWKEEKRFEFELSTFRNETRTDMFDSILVNSPEPYSGNILYTSI